jgi:hypothetical protein
MMACVVGDERDRDTKGAQQANGPQWTAQRVSGGGPGLGGGVAAYSRELLRGALIYAGRAFPSCRAKRKESGP